METALKSASVTSHASIQDLQTHYEIKKGSPGNLMQLYSYKQSELDEISLSAVRTYVLAANGIGCKWEKLFQCTGGPLPDDSILKRRLDEYGCDLYVRTHRVNGRIRFGLACIVGLRNNKPNHFQDIVVKEIPTTIKMHLNTPKELPDRFLEIVRIAGDRWLRSNQLHLVQGGKWLANPTRIESAGQHISYKKNDITVKFTPTEFMASISVEAVSSFKSDRNLKTLDKELQVLNEQLLRIAGLIKSYTS